MPLAFLWLLLRVPHGPPLRLLAVLAEKAYKAVEHELEQAMLQSLQLIESKAPDDVVERHTQKIEQLTKRTRIFKKAWQLILGETTTENQGYKSVLKDLPVFQLKNNVINKSKEVFRTVTDFLVKFEVSLEVHNLPLATNWERCMLATLSKEQLSWFRETMRGKGYTWEQAKAIFQQRYGAVSQSAALVAKLHKMRMREDQDPMDYVEKFEKLMRDAGEVDSVTLGNIFVNSLIPALHSGVRMTQTAHPEPKPKLTVERVSNLIAGLYTEDGFFNSTAHSSDDESTASGHSKAQRNPPKKRKNNKEAIRPHDVCPKHPNDNHSRKECYSYQKGKDKATFSSQNPKKQDHRASGDTKKTTLCRYCSKPWVPYHKCSEYWRCKTKGGAQATTCFGHCWHPRQHRTNIKHKTRVRRR